jgi:hypothetical protein
MKTFIPEPTKKTVGSKSLAFRVPIEQYIEVVKKASDMKLSVSEYLIMKIFG